jgi:hypothetical protein
MHRSRRQHQLFSLSFQFLSSNSSMPKPLGKNGKELDIDRAPRISQNIFNLYCQTLSN